MPDTPEKSGENPVLEPQPHGGALMRGGSPGRPPGSVSLVSALKRQLAENPALVDDLMQSLIQQAQGGDVQAMKVLLDRVDGAVKQGVEHSGPDGGAIDVRRLPDDLFFKLAEHVDPETAKQIRDQD